MSSSFCSYGDLGDILYLCPSMKLVAGNDGHPVTLYAKNGLREHDPFTAKIPLIESLLLEQDYVEAVLPFEEQVINHDASLFRDRGHPFGVTLASLQAQWLVRRPGDHRGRR